jgi:hypothetical protein
LQGLEDKSPGDWISWRFTAATQLGRQVDKLSGESQEDRVTDALELASYLLDIDTESSIQEMRRLLRLNWPGRDRLIGLVYEQVSDLDDDDETRINWLARLGLDESQGFNFPHSGPEES